MLAIVITRRKSPLQRKVFTRNEGKQGPSLPYIPSGSFAKAMLIEGADANASVTGNESTVAVFVLISLLVNVRTSVQIIDNSDLVKVHRVDNVPVGLAMPLSLTTRIGHAMVVSYEMIFTQPDSVTYSKTGMLFGANLIVKSTDFLSRNPE
ncbi:TPA: conjugal transfer protein TraG N-terminal domain-containing protein, partial [Escherichia coli]